MMREVREIIRLIRKINKKIDIAGERDYKLEETVKKIVKTIDNEFTEDEKVTFLIFVMKELSFKKALEHPEFMLRQNNVTLRSFFFIALLLSFVSLITGLLFSTGPFVEAVLSLTRHLYHLFTMGRG